MTDFASALSARIAKWLDGEHACFTGDCPHASHTECLDAIATSGADFGYAFAREKSIKSWKAQEILYKEAEKRIAELEEKFSYLAKVPTEPYEKQMAKRILALEAALRECVARCRLEQTGPESDVCAIAAKALEASK